MAPKKSITIILLSVTILIFLGCKNNKIGDSTINANIENSTITIENLPHGTIGITGLNSISYPEGFSFEKIDEAVYDKLVSENFVRNSVAINIQYGGKDNYGKDTLGKVITIGHLEVEESRKYATFQDWKSKYRIFDLIRSYSASKIETKERNVSPDTSRADNAKLRLPDPDDLTTAQNIAIIVSKSKLKIDRDNGVGQLKFGMTVEEVSKVCNQSKPERMNGYEDTYFADILTNSFYLSGRKVESVRVVYFRGVLLRILISLKPYIESADKDHEDGKNRTGNDDVYHEISSRYGSWGGLLETGEENEVLKYSVYEIQGEYVKVRRKEWRLLLQTSPEEGELLCPGDIFMFSSILIEDWQKSVSR